MITKLENGRIYDPFLGLNKISDILIKDGLISKIKGKISSLNNKSLTISDALAIFFISSFDLILIIILISFLASALNFS